MYCPKCGTENPDDAQLCRSCSWVLAGVSTVTPSPEVRTSRLAIAALVLGILSLFTCFVTAIPAIILGIIGLVKIEKSAGRLKGKGLAIAGFAVPVILLPILLMGILVPALAKTRIMARRMVCANNLKQLGLAIQFYATDNHQKYPTPDKWCDLLVEHASVPPKIFICKGASTGRCNCAFRCKSEPVGPCNYAMNINVEKMGTLSPPDMVLLFETQPGWNQAGGPEILTTKNHHGEGCNIVFVDGHVEFVKTKYLKYLKWKGREDK